ncbi:hypothetical protein SAMN02745857_02158 [Andreprevotia lacus DSM 23236]|uniref:Uncharacterized protein n=1 Tax=Andreprevotia lacus DSM 23236 TaxID=1121001 RepID=A0A1W1XNF0_9NEIS|nr:hypothetical protein SAMN02745857_02158 [Andreprevotia lacus DSM 23236]
MAHRLYETGEFIHNLQCSRIDHHSAKFNNFHLRTWHQALVATRRLKIDHQVVRNAAQII